MEDPDLQLGAFSLWVLHRQFPQASDFWDGNWLYVRAQVQAQGAQVKVEGSILHLSELATFLEQCLVLHDVLDGSAVLDCMEPNLSLRLTITSSGALTVDLSITPDQVTQSHQFMLDLDQSYLPQLISGLRAVLRRYPIREPEKLTNQPDR